MRRAADVATTFETPSAALATCDRRNAQIAVIGRRSTERIEPIPSLPFEYWLAGGILSLARHYNQRFNGFCAKPHDARRVRHERNPEDCGDSGLGCGRL